MCEIDENNILAVLLKKKKQKHLISNVSIIYAKILCVHKILFEAWKHIKLCLKELSIKLT